MRQDKRAAPKAPINENISAREVRLIGADGEQIGIVSIDEALRIAEESKLDLVRFLSDGDRAKVSLRFRGREMAHQELGMELLKRVEADLLEYGSVEQHPKMEGRQLIMVIAPKKKK